MRNKWSSAIVLIGTVATPASSWFLIWIFARSHHGADLVGAYSLILAILTPIFVVAQMGLRTLFLSALEKWPWRTYVLLRSIGVTTGIIVVAGFLFLTPGILIPLATAVCALKVTDSFLDLQLARIQYANRMFELGLLTTMNGVLTALTGGLVFWVSDSAPFAVYASALSSLIVAVFAQRLGRESYDTTVSAPLGALAIFRSSIPVTISQFLSSLLFQLPVIFLASTGSSQAVGIFAGAAYLLTMANILGSSLQTLLITPLRKRRESRGVEAMFKTSVRVVIRSIVVGIPLGAVVILFGSDVLLFIYGPEFVIGRSALSLLAIAAVSTTSAYVMSVTLNVMNRYAYVTLALSLSCLLVVLSGVVLVSFLIEPLLGAFGMVAVGAVSRLLLLFFIANKFNSQ